MGTGRAEKEQVAFMVRRLLNLRDARLALDTTDALAVAICHLTMRRFAALAREGHFFRKLAGKQMRPVGMSPAGRIARMYATGYSMTVAFLMITGSLGTSSW